LYETFKKRIPPSGGISPGNLPCIAFPEMSSRLSRISRERNVRRRFAAAHPTVPTATVAALATDVHDLASLRQVGQLMTA
jgi:hypothetical protein